jgi:hypothetical protein
MSSPNPFAPPGAPVADTAPQLPPGNLNSGLLWLHWIFCVFYVVSAIALGIMGVRVDAAGALVALVPLAIAALHFYAAKGARLGRNSGKTLSRIIGVLWLFGFPIGTLLGLWVFNRTSAKNWQSR